MSNLIMMHLVSEDELLDIYKQDPDQIERVDFLDEFGGAFTALSVSVYTKDKQIVPQIIIYDFEKVEGVQKDEY